MPEDKELLREAVSVLKKKEECVRGSKRVGQEEAKVGQSVKNVIKFFAYKTRKWTKSQDQFPFKTPAGVDKGNLVLFIPSYIRYRLLKM